MGETPSRVVSFIDGLARQNSEALSFIPTPRLEQYVERGQVLIARENEEPAGFLVFGRSWPQIRIYQACIQYDARRRQHGLDLVERLVGIARDQSCTDVRLWCAEDLEANEFWQLAGFERSGARTGGARRGRIHILWARRLGNTLFERAGASSVGALRSAENRPSDPPITDQNTTSRIAQKGPSHD